MKSTERQRYMITKEVVERAIQAAKNGTGQIKINSDRFEGVLDIDEILKLTGGSIRVNQGEDRFGIPYNEIASIAAM